MNRDDWIQFIRGAALALFVAAATILLVSCPRISARRDGGGELEP